MSYLSNLPIRIKIFLYLSMAFLLSLVIGSVIIQAYTRQTARVDIEERLKGATGMVANMVAIAMQHSTQQQLQAVVAQNLAILSHYHRLVQRGDLSLEDAQSRMAAILLSQSIDQAGYLFVLATNRAPEHLPAVVHPHLQGQDLGYVRLFQEMAQAKSGYRDFEWKDPGETASRQKGAYFSWFEPWGWLLAAVADRSANPAAARIEAFRETILASRFGKSGNAFIIDTSGNIILHPYLKGNYYNAIDTEGRMFIKEICQQQSGQITYSWKSPEMTHAVSVLAAFQLLPELDWIVVSSVNLDEFNTPLVYVRNLVIATFLFSLLLAFLLSFWSSSQVIGSIAKMKNLFEKGAFGDTSVRMQWDTLDEIGQLAGYFNAFMEMLENKQLALEKEILERKEIEKRLVRQNLNQARQMELHGKVQGDLEGKALAANILEWGVRQLEADVAGLYVAEPDGEMRLLGTWGAVPEKGFAERIHPGEGLLGQVMLEKKPLLITSVAEKGAPGDAAGAPHILVHPFISGGDLKGMVEVRSSKPYPETERALLEEVGGSIASTLNSLVYREQMERLLQQTRELAHQLQARQQELHASNAALEVQARVLKEQKESMEHQNRDLENAKTLIAQKLKDLESANQYKLQFLANMSHELRTPLNSILILSKLLSENKPGPLTEKQRELIDTIHAAGSDLLQLINEILDLSKIEAGKMDLHLSEQPLYDHVQRMERYFSRLAQEKGLVFKTHIDPDVPTHFITDHQRLDQIVANLLANAFKFTAEGSVRLRIGRPPADQPPMDGRCEPKSMLAFAVTDTGIGIKSGNEQIIFDAFQQGDGSIGRKYGGTGLGLSISRQLATLLGGDIQVRSQEGKGSTFTLYLPLQVNRRQDEGRKRGAEKNGSPASEAELMIGMATGLETAPAEDTARPPALVERQRGRAGQPAFDESILKGKTLLVIDDDMRTAFALASLFEGKGMQVLIGRDGKDGLDKLKAHPGMAAVLVDIMMPEMNGFETIKEIRKQKRFKRLPVIAVTAMAMKGDREACLQAGADEYLVKPFEADALVSVLCAQLISLAAAAAP